MTAPTYAAAPHSHEQTSCPPTESGGLERTRFFARQLVTPDDLTQDQIYFREKMRRHNRMLHGWGVVCGACVRRRGDCELVVEPGYVLGPYGDEIAIDRETVFDVCRNAVDEHAGCCGEELDPWCGDARRNCSAGTVYLAVRYSECQARPVRSASGACGCGCDEDACEYSRIRDSFTLKLLTELPEGYWPVPRPTLSSMVPCTRDRRGRDCPPCPRDPWVILADVVLDDTCHVRAVNCFAHRRYVVSFAEFFLTCEPRPGRTVSGRDVPTQLADVRALAALTGIRSLVDVRDALTLRPPTATVLMKDRAGRPLVLPAHFTVERDETVKSLLEREGEREYFDPDTEETFTLRELYETAGVPPATRFGGTAAALAPFEGKTLNLAEAPASGAALAGLLDRRALERLAREPGGVGGRATELAATSLTGVSRTSAIGRKLRSMTIGTVAALDRDAFLGRMLRGAPASEQEQLRHQASEVWDRARRVAELSGDQEAEGANALE